MENPCARFKPLRDAAGKANSRPPTYSQDEIDRLLTVCTVEERTAFITLLPTGLREQELCYLTWQDVRLEADNECVVVRSKPGFSPKDYEEREIPLGVELAKILRELPRKAIGYSRVPAEA